MNKETFIAKLQGKTGVIKKEAEAQYDAFVETFVEGLKEDEIVDLTKFIKVEVVPTKARKGRNPSTGEPIDIPAGKKLKVTQQKYLKDIAK